MIQDIYTVWLREMKRFIRARSRVITGLAMPFFWLLFIGVGFGSSVQLPGVDYLAFLAPGIIGMNILFTSIFAGTSVIYDRQFGFLKEILVSPISRTSIVLGKTIGGATVAMITGLIMLGVAIGIGAVKISTGLLIAPIIMFLTAIAFVGLGLVMASRMKSMEGFQALMSFLVMPMFFLSGALFPLQNTPVWMQMVSKFDPLTYGVDGIRNVLIGQSMNPLWMDFSVLIGFCILFTLMGNYLFSKSS